MEILGIIGIIILILVFFVGGGLLGWIFKGFGEVIDFLLKGWGSCLSVIFWIFAFIVVLMALAM